VRQNKSFAEEQLGDSAVISSFYSSGLWWIFIARTYTASIMGFVISGEFLKETVTYKNCYFNRKNGKMLRRNSVK
jgi:hypothetical protein